MSSSSTHFLYTSNVTSLPFRIKHLNQRTNNQVNVHIGLVHWHTYLELGSMEINIVSTCWSSIVPFSTRNTNVWTDINDKWTFSLLHWVLRNSISFILCSGIDLPRPSTMHFEITDRHEEIFTTEVDGVIALNASILLYWWLTGSTNKELLKGLLQVFCAFEETKNKGCMLEKVVCDNCWGVTWTTGIGCFCVATRGSFFLWLSGWCWFAEVFPVVTFFE